MLLVVEDEGVLEVRWTWLPYWIGANARLMASLNDRLAARAAADPAQTLDEHHSWLLHELQREFEGFSGLVGFLSGLRDVAQKP